MSAHFPENDAIRQAAILAVHHLEARESDPSVEQYVDAVLSVIPPGTGFVDGTDLIDGLLESDPPGADQ